MSNDNITTLSIKTNGKTLPMPSPSLPVPKASGRLSGSNSPITGSPRIRHHLIINNTSAPPRSYLSSPIGTPNILRRNPSGIDGSISAASSPRQVTKNGAHRLSAQMNALGVSPMQGKKAMQIRSRSDSSGNSSLSSFQGEPSISVISRAQQGAPSATRGTVDDSGRESGGEISFHGNGARDLMAYSNRGFVSDDEIVLSPASFRPQGMDDGATGEEDAFVDEMVVIERPIYSQKDFDQGFEGGNRPQRNMRTWMKAKARKCECSCSCVRRFFTSHLPFLAIMREYSLRHDLLADIIAGLTVGIMHIPQGMAYGQLSTLPPVYGLYVSFFPVILYFFLGTSKHVSIGTFAVVSLMVGSAVDKGLKAQGLSPVVENVTLGTLDSENHTMFKEVDNSEEILDMKLQLAMAVTFAVGVLQFLLGVLRLGFLTVYLSDPLISGFTTGAACHVFTSQIKHIFGISMGRYSGAFKLIFSYRDIFVNLPNTNAVTFIASIVCMLVLIVVKEYINNNPKIKPRLKMPVPVELIVVVLGTVISHFVQLEETYEVQVVGDVPVGIPEPNLKAFPMLSSVVSDAIAIAIVAFAISVSMAKIFAKKHEYDVDSNQELLAYGICNVFSAFFSSFVSAVSLSRSLVQENVGGRTQVTGLVSSALLLVVLLFVGPYFKTLPNCILASIILVALKGMFKQFGELKRLWNISIIDFTVWLVTFSATALLDVDLGLLVGVVFALLTVIMRSQRPYSCLLGQVPGTDIYRDISVYKVAEETPNVKIFRFDSALFFANAEFFKSSLYKLAVDPNELKRKQRKLNKRKKKEEKELLNVTVEDRNKSTKELDGQPPSATEATPVDPPIDRAATQEESTPVSPAELQEEMRGMPEIPTLTDVHYVILDCSTMSYVDSMGVKTLQQIITEYKLYNITVYLAQCKSGVREMFERTNFYQTGSKNFMFITIHDAVVSAQLHKWSITADTSGQANNNGTTGEGDDADGEDGDERTPVVGDVDTLDNINNNTTGPERTDV